VIVCSGMRLGLALPLFLVLAFLAPPQSEASDLALVGAKIYLSPSESPIESGTVLVHGSHILSVGPIAEIEVPRAAIVIDCKGLVVTAGFWDRGLRVLPGCDPERCIAQSTQSHTAAMTETLYSIPAFG
jgi:hypothetical protein